jgi:hypothetical protein
MTFVCVNPVLAVGCSKILITLSVVCCPGAAGKDEAGDAEAAAGRHRLFAVVRC